MPEFQILTVGSRRLNIEPFEVQSSTTGESAGSPYQSNSAAITALSRDKISKVITPGLRKRLRRTEFLPLYRPWITSQELRRIQVILESNEANVSVEQLESALSEYTNCGQAIAFASIDAALCAALNALEIGIGDEVVAPAIGLESTMRAIWATGAQPVLCDVDDHLTISAESAASCLSLRTKAIVCSHWGGQACDIASVVDLCRRCSIHLIEDTTHSLGATYRTRFLGTFGVFGIYGFHLTGDPMVSDGAVLVTADQYLAQRVRKDPLFRASRMNSLQAALALGSLEKQELFLELRTRHALTYRQQLSDLPVRLPAVRADCRAAWHLFVVAAEWERLKLTREELLARLHYENIGSGAAGWPLHMLNGYCTERIQLPAAGHPGSPPPASAFVVHQRPITAEDLGRQTILLPLFAGMTETDLHDVIAVVREIVGRSGQPSETR